LCLNANGTALLIDPGACEYVGEERRLFRSSRFHNTLTVDGQGQAQPKGPFSWTRLPQVRAEGWITGRGFDLFVGSHNGYEPIVHRRWVFSLRSRFWLVRDLVLGDGEHALDLFWHLNPEMSSKEDVFTEHTGRNGLRILTTREHSWRRELRAGWWSPVYGKKEPASVLHFGTVANLPSEFVTLLGPVSAMSPQTGDLSRIAVATGKLVAYCYETAEETHMMIFGNGDKAWTISPFQSDAEFLYWGRDRLAGRGNLILCNGSYLEALGENVISSSSAVLRCELQLSEQGLEVFCSDENVVVREKSLRAIWPEGASKVTGSGETVS
jgi:hypothetical protein